VLASAAWDGFDVPGSPYAVLVDGSSAAVIGQGVAHSWAQLGSLVAQHLDDLEFTGGPGGAARRRGEAGGERGEAGRSRVIGGPSGVRPRASGVSGGPTPSSWPPGSTRVTRACIRNRARGPAPVPQRDRSRRSVDPPWRTAPVIVAVALAVVAGLRSSWSP
jgi:hypothetical protein